MTTGTSTKDDSVSQRLFDFRVGESARADVVQDRTGGQLTVPRRIDHEVAAGPRGEDRGAEGPSECDPASLGAQPSQRVRQRQRPVPRCHHARRPEWLSRGRQRPARGRRRRSARPDEVDRLRGHRMDRPVRPAPSVASWSRTRRRPRRQEESSRSALPSAPAVSTRRTTFATPPRPIPHERPQSPTAAIPQPDHITTPDTTTFTGPQWRHGAGGKYRPVQGCSGQRHPAWVRKGGSPVQCGQFAFRRFA